MVDEQTNTERVSDEELDLVETERLILALGRRHQALIVAGLIQPEASAFEVDSNFIPNVVACAGLMEALMVSHDMQMRQMRCLTVQAVHAKQRGEHREEQK